MGSHIEFNEHALEEIANGTLDRWFTDSQETAAPIHRLSAEDMEHVERSSWLNSVLSPRPVVVAGAFDEAGERNLLRSHRSCRSPRHHPISRLPSPSTRTNAPETPTTTCAKAQPLCSASCPQRPEVPPSLMRPPRHCPVEDEGLSSLERSSGNRCSCRKP